MLLRDGEDFEHFSDKARAWFYKHNATVLTTAERCKSYLSANVAPYDFFGTSGESDEKIVPSFPIVSSYIDLENRNNARHRAISSGLCEMLARLTDQKIVRNDLPIWHIINDPAIALFRDLEFHRLRPWDAENTIEMVRRRYYPSDVIGGKELHRFASKVITPLVEAGLVDAKRQAKGYQVVSGAVLVAFTDIALIPFIEKRGI